MIKKSLVLLAAERLKGKTTAFNIQPCSLLADAVGHSIPVMGACNVPIEEAMERFAEAVEVTTTGADNTLSEHDREQDAQAQQLAAIVAPQIGYIRNVIKPLYLDFMSQLAKWKATAHIQSASSMFEVVQQDVPELVKDDSFFSAVSEFKAMPAGSVKQVIRFKEKTREELLELAKPGTTRLDNIFVTDILSEETDYLSAVWRAFYGTSVLSDNTQSTCCDLTGRLNGFESVFDLNPVESIHVCMIGYLFAIKLVNKPEEAETQLSLGEYKNSLYNLRDFFAGALVSVTKRVADMMKNTTLVLQHRPASKKVVVFRSVYQEWLKAGNKPEMLFGQLLSNNLTVYGPSISQQGQALLNAWNDYLALWESREQSKKMDYYRDQLRYIFFNMLNNKDDAEKELHTRNVNMVTLMLEKADAYINSIYSADMERDHDHALKLIAGIRFGYTSAEQFLKDMVEAQTVNENIQMREAAMLATFKYLCRYQASQFTIA